MLLHAGEGHLKARGKLADGGVPPPEVLEYPAPSRIRQRRERGIELLRILNHMVQYMGLLAARQYPYRDRSPIEEASDGRGQIGHAERFVKSHPALFQVSPPAAGEVEN